VLVLPQCVLVRNSGVHQLYWCWSRAPALQSHFRTVNVLTFERSRLQTLQRWKQWRTVVRPCSCRAESSAPPLVKSPTLTSPTLLIPERGPGLFKGLTKALSPASNRLCLALGNSSRQSKAGKGREETVFSGGAGAPPGLPSLRDRDLSRSNIRALKSPKRGQGDLTGKHKRGYNRLCP